jgi:hypothetical protein
MSTGSSTSLAARRKAGLGDPMRAGSRPFQREKSWYNVDGIFVDQTASSSSYVGRYYQPLVNYITSLLPGVMLNPGVYPDQAYANIKVPVGHQNAIRAKNQRVLVGLIRVQIGPLRTFPH